MAELKDPALPPGAIVATHEDDDTLEEGQVRRNDGEVLNPASKNPWYVLATVVEEQTGQHPMKIDSKLHAQNRRFWNGWMCREMDQIERTAIATKLQVNEDELKPLSKEESALLKARFAENFKGKAEERFNTVDATSPDFSVTFFSKAVSLEGMFFGYGADFSAAHFKEYVGLNNTCFPKMVRFNNVHFGGGASFQNAHFGISAIFKDAYFAAPANFSGSCINFIADFSGTRFSGENGSDLPGLNKCAEFSGANLSVGIFNYAYFSGEASFEKTFFKNVANFEAAHFASDAVFKGTVFGGNIDFSNGTFKSRTDFTEAKFETRVPKFFQREMHHDTSFSDRSKFWPDVTEKNAEDGKRAYTRLRQVASEVYDPDLEHFFLRQEMRCKEVLAGRFDKVMFVLYRKVADSGISVKRPFAVLMALWALGAAMFAGYFVAPLGHEVPETVADSPGWSGIGLSFANVFAFLGLSRAFYSDVLASLPVCLKYFAGFQTIGGAVFFFLLALGLRNRFRLK